MSRYKLLNNEYGTYYIRVSSAKFAFTSISLPLFAFTFCIIYSIAINFDESTATDCGSYNILPSISEATSSYSPQKQVWKIGIILQAVPRFIMAACYVQYNRKVLKEISAVCVRLACAFNTIECIALIMLTLLDSSDHYPTHEKSVIIFIISSQLYMTLLIFIHTSYRKTHARNSERKSDNWKIGFALINILGITMATYLSIGYHHLCADYTHTWFALCEYVVVLSNLGFHMTAVFDFKGRNIVIYDKGMTLSTDEYKTIYI